SHLSCMLGELRIRVFFFQAEDGIRDRTVMEFRRVLFRSEAINRTGIARMYGRDPADIIVVNHDAALAIKVSFPRPQSSGSKYDSDVYGGQQYAPLLSLPVPD